MNITTEDIIKILPMDQSLKDQLSKNWSSLDSNRKFVLEQMLWDTYFTLYRLKREENLEEAFLKLGEDKEKIDQDFYRRVEEKTERDMQQQAVSLTETADLKEAREAMQKIIQEMKAAGMKVN